MNNLILNFIWICFYIFLILPCIKNKKQKYKICNGNEFRLGAVTSSVIINGYFCDVNLFHNTII